MSTCCSHYLHVHEVTIIVTKMCFLVSTCFKHGTCTCCVVFNNEHF